MRSKVPGFRWAHPAHARFVAGLLCAGLFSAEAVLAQQNCTKRDNVYWDSVKTCTDAGDVESYLTKFEKKGCYVEAARTCLEELRRQALTPKCAGMSEGAECWKQTADKPGCYVWDGHLYPNQTVTWSGACSDGIGVGPGTMVRTREGKNDTNKGTLVRGKYHGRWVLRFASGTVGEGPYVDGKRHGRWVLRFASGNRLEFDYRHGSKDGLPGTYITKAGKRHPGKWTGECFRDSEGNLRAWFRKKENCTSN